MAQAAGLLGWPAGRSSLDFFTWQAGWSKTAGKNIGPEGRCCRPEARATGGRGPTRDPWLKPWAIASFAPFGRNPGAACYAQQDVRTPRA
jgi:hypothetical protein